MHAHRGPTLFPRLSLVLLLTQICIISSLPALLVSAVPAPAPAPEHVVTVFGFPVTIGGEQPGFGSGGNTNPFGNGKPFGNGNPFGGAGGGLGGGGAAQKTTTTKTKAAPTPPAAPPAAPPATPPAAPPGTPTPPPPPHTTAESKAPVTPSSPSVKKSSSSSSAIHTPAGNLGGAGANPSNAITDNGKGISAYSTLVMSSGSSATNLPSTASASSKSSSGLLAKILVPLILVLLLLIGAVVWMRRRDAAKKQRRFTFTDKSASGFAEKSEPGAGAGAGMSAWSRFDSSSPFASVASLVTPPPVPAKSKTPLTQTPTRQRSYRVPPPLLDADADASEVDITDFIGSSASLQTHGDARSMVPTAGHGTQSPTAGHGAVSVVGSTVGHGSGFATQGHSPAIPSSVYPDAYPIPTAAGARTSTGRSMAHRTDDGHSLYNAAADYNGYYQSSDSPLHDEPALAESRPASPSPFRSDSNPNSHPGSPSPYTSSPFAHPSDTVSVSSETGGLSPSLEAEMHEFGHGGGMHSPAYSYTARTPSPVYGLGGPAYEVPPHRHPNPGQRSSAVYDPRNETLLAYERDSVHQDRSDVYGGMA
ncbi:hypothetical protein C8F04DRAFT_1197655 [Mycena alexandri]|uniref:Uncharacterized protein n=1 Tax=Mycena alexandri TaxID=1745969 RepID=A0AAD6S397_9AGAR|nr:hypothetical protein C8F04DRAFT_1197655 [Mycena alexandri]